MTTQEHKLVLGIFAKQAQLIRVLLTILKSRGIVEYDDPSAFEFATTEDADANAALLGRVTENYLLLAKSLGVETGLENL